MMFETYGFEVATGHGTTLEYFRLSDLRGMKLVSVSDTASVSFDIQSSSNLYFNGQQFQNRRAQGREMELTFEYDYTIPPAEADRELFQKLSFGLSQYNFSDFPQPDYEWHAPDDKFVLKFTKNDGTIKKTMCSVKRVEHAVYEEKPQLKILLETQAYWRGHRESIRFNPNAKSLNAPVELKGDIAFDFLLDITFDDIGEYISFELKANTFHTETDEWSYTYFDTSFPVDSSLLDFTSVRVGWDDGKFVFTEGTTRPLYDYQTKIFPKLHPSAKSISVSSSTVMRAVNIVYTPLYIR